MWWVIKRVVTRQTGWFWVESARELGYFLAITKIL
jgi:hypothetical protein